MNGPPLYHLDGIRRVIGGDKVILDVDALSLPNGGLTAIVGPNGAGKSTLLSLLAFLTRPDRGSIRFRGTPVGPRDHAALRRQVTLVDQKPLLFRGTVFDNVSYGLRVRKVPSAERPDRVEEALSMVDLGGFAGRSIAGLSGGETQRVALARALVIRPQVVLLDEPTAGVDVARMEMVESLIRDLFAATGVSILFSTHDLSQAHRLTDRVIHLAGGKPVPTCLENLFRGQAGADRATGLVHLKCGTTIRTDCGQTGPVRLAIPAAAVRVEPFSDREERINHFDGTVTRMELRGAKVRLLVSGRLNLRAEMTPEELQRKGLELGSRVTASVAPESIRVLERES